MSAKFEIAEKIEFLLNIMDSFEAIAEEAGVLSAKEVKDHIRSLRLFYLYLNDLKQHYQPYPRLELQSISNQFFENYGRCLHEYEENGELDDITASLHFDDLKETLSRLSELQEKV